MIFSGTYSLTVSHYGHQHSTTIQDINEYHDLMAMFFQEKVGNLGSHQISESFKASVMPIRADHSSLSMDLFIPRALYNATVSQDNHPFISYLKDKGFPENLQKGILSVHLKLKEETMNRDRSIKLIKNEKEVELKIGIFDQKLFFLTKEGTKSVCSETHVDESEWAKWFTHG